MLLRLSDTLSPGRQDTDTGEQEKGRAENTVFTGFLSRPFQQNLLFCISYFMKEGYLCFGSFYSIWTNYSNTTAKSSMPVILCPLFSSCKCFHVSISRETFPACRHEPTLKHLNSILFFIALHLGGVLCFIFFSGDT